MRISLLLLASLVLTIQSVQANHSLKVLNVHFMRKKGTIVSVPSPRHNKHHHAALSIPRGGAWSIFGWNVPANQLAKLYVGFTGINGVAMAVLPTIAANLYGSAFDDSPESLLAITLLERQGNAVLGTGILLYLSTFTPLPISKSIAWSTVPYVLSLLKFLGTGQVTSIGFDSRVAIVMLMSILVPLLSIVTEKGNSLLAANVLATIMLVYGVFGSISPGSSASLEGLDISSSPSEW